MKRLSTLLLSGIMGVAVLFPATPALADNNPCKGQAPGPHCRPPCFYTVVVHPGDPANGVAPWVEIKETFC
jgi:hypothetical protein